MEAQCQQKGKKVLDSQNSCYTLQISNFGFVNLKSSYINKPFWPSRSGFSMFIITFSDHIFFNLHYLKVFLKNNTSFQRVVTE